MTWRGSTTPMDRVFACLVYLLPLVQAYQYAPALFSQLPQIRPLFLPLDIVAGIYASTVGIIPFGQLVVLILLLMFVVRNERIRHFVRFNTMQAILVGIGLAIFSILWQIIFDVVPGVGAGGGILMPVVFNVLFLGTLAIAAYAIFQSARGRYAEIPTLSEAVYMQVR